MRKDACALNRISFFATTPCYVTLSQSIHTTWRYYLDTDSSHDELIWLIPSRLHSVLCVGQTRSDSQSHHACGLSKQQQQVAVTDFQHSSRPSAISSKAETRICDPEMHSAALGLFALSCCMIMPSQLHRKPRSHQSPA